MTGPKMTPERLAEVREMCSPLARRHASWDAIHDAVAHIDALAEDLADRVTEAEWSTKRADAAEAKLAAIDAPFHGGALHHIEMLHADQRERCDREEALVLKLDAAEAKLAALVEALDRLEIAKPCEEHNADVAAFDAALRAARGEP